MANLLFDPENTVYPPRCYAVPTPNKITFREPNITGPRPEINFNKYMYFSPNPENGNLQIISDQCIRDIIRSPESPWEPKLHGMVMIGPGLADFVPAHLPNLTDLVGVVDVKELYDKLNKEVFHYNPHDISEVIPIFLLNVVDPTHVVAIEGPVYPLTTREVTTELACYTDGFVAFYLHSNVSEITVRVCACRFMVHPYLRYMDVNLQTEYKEGNFPFPLGASIVVWNARGVSRPYFKSNIIEIGLVHKPIIFIITEVRIGVKSFKEVVKAFDFEVNYCLDKSIGYTGGVAVIWDKKKVISGEFNIAATDMNSNPIRLLGVLKVAPATATVTEEGDWRGCIKDRCWRVMKQRVD